MAKGKRCIYCGKFFRNLKQHEQGCPMKKKKRRYPWWHF